MNSIMAKHHYLTLSFLLVFVYFNPVHADPIATNNELSDDDAQDIFDRAMEERDSGKVYNAIEKFEYILGRRPSLNRARLELAVTYHRASQYDEA